MAHGISTKFRLTLRSIPRNVRRVEHFLQRIGKALLLDEIQMHKLMVSVTEAVNNAIVHGNKANPDKRVFVRCETFPGWLLCIVKDEGRGFHPEKVRNPLDDENLLRENGRGIFLMRTLMDKVDFRITEDGTEVQLWLRLST